MAIPITNITEEIPIIFNAWLNIPEMRKNVDIHLLFNDQVDFIKLFILLLLLLL